ncbi:MAG: phenylalanine--tRNA ligase subunit beta [Thermoplasmata archaeon]|nr:phenylalanine--tRNA ligase subunit beta [Thermoplasmata archaeon]
MAVITMSYRDLVNLIGQDISQEELLAMLPMMGSDIDSVDGDVMNVEFFPNRPDLYSVEGVARAVRGFMGKETGLAQYPVEHTDNVLNVDPSVAKIRPFIVAGIVRNVKMTDELIASLMEAQEKLHLTLGRKRKKVAIGVHDMSQLKFPFTYKAVDPKKTKFAPLGYTIEMDMSEILTRHEKGMEYAWTLEGKPLYPIILDADGKVLSFPPIINGNITTVTDNTTDLFLDLTGTDLNTLKTALNIIAALLAERGGQIQTVKVIYPDEEMILPDMEPRKRLLMVAEANALLGTNYSAEQIVQFLGKMRFGAEASGDEISVQVPGYRNDIIHSVDLMEDIAISAGYDKIVGTMPKSRTFGAELPLEVLSNNARKLMVGHTYLEVKSLALSCEKEQFEMMLRPESSDLIKIQNPINEYLTCVRMTLVPSMLAVFRANKHRDLPQNIFEVGSIGSGVQTIRHLAALSLHSKASFTEAKSLVQTVLRDLNIRFTLGQCDDPAYIPGRAAEILVDGKSIGNFGEYHPQVLENFELGYPVAGFEIELEIEKPPLPPPSIESGMVEVE